MKLLDLLRKLGIYRSGSVSGTYTNAIDRPTEMMMDDVMDAKKDLTTKDDLKKAVGAAGSMAGKNQEKVTKVRKIFFWLMLALGALFLIGYFSAGFSFRLIIFLILWIFFLIWLRRFAFQGAYATWFAIVISIVVFIFSLLIFPSSDQKDPKSNSTSGSELKKYDRKVYAISGEDGKVSGTAAISVKNNLLRVMYHFKIKDNIPTNTSIDCVTSTKMSGYHYVGNLLTPLSKNKNHPAGSFGAAYCNHEAEPQDLFAFIKREYQCPKPPTTGMPTDTFVPNFEFDYFSIEEFLAANTYEVYDASNAWVKNEKGDGCSQEDDIAISQGKKIKAYMLTFTERK